MLTDVIDQVHLEGTVYVSAELHAPWGISIARQGRTPFYLVREGRAQLQVGSRGRVHHLAGRGVRAGGRGARAARALQR